VKKILYSWVTKVGLKFVLVVECVKKTTFFMQKAYVEERI
jgi:hypothetical protein